MDTFDRLVLSVASGEAPPALLAGVAAARGRPGCVRLARAFAGCRAAEAGAGSGAELLRLCYRTARVLAASAAAWALAGCCSCRCDGTAYLRPAAADGCEAVPGTGYCPAHGAPECGSAPEVAAG